MKLKPVHFFRNRESLIVYLLVLGLPETILAEENQGLLSEFEEHLAIFSDTVEKKILVDGCGVYVLQENNHVCFRDGVGIARKVEYFNLLTMDTNPDNVLVRSNSNNSIMPNVEFIQWDIISNVEQSPDEKSSLESTDSIGLFGLENEEAMFSLDPELSWAPAAIGLIESLEYPSYEIVEICGHNLSVQHQFRSDVSLLVDPGWAISFVEAIDTYKREYCVSTGGLLN